VYTVAKVRAAVPTSLLGLEWWVFAKGGWECYLFQPALVAMPSAVAGARRAVGG